MSSGSHVQPVASARVIPFLIAAGWVLLFSFGCCAAALRQIAVSVRVFQAAYVAGFAGYLVLLWIVQRGDAAAPPGSWRWWVAGCIALRVTLLLMQPSDDAYRYVWEGRVQLAGFNPYSHPPSDPQLAALRNADWPNINHSGYRAIYGPVAQVEFLCAAAVYPSIYTVKLLHVVWDGLVIAVLAASLGRMGRRPYPVIGYALCPLVLTSFAVEGHVDSLMLLFVTLSFWAVLARHPKLAGAMLGLAMATKVVAFVFWPWFLVRHRRAAAVAVGVLVLSYLPYLSAGPALFSSLFRFAARSEFFSFLGTLGVTSFDTSVARGGVTLGAGAMLGVLAWRRTELRSYAPAASAALLLALPIVHYWYLTWTLVWTPLVVRGRWVVAALTMAVSFEAGLHRVVSGTWVMPEWSPLVVWLSFLAAWLVEAAAASRARG